MKNTSLTETEDIEISTEAVYVTLRASKVSQTKQIAPNVLIDYDDNGEVVGVEVLRT